MRRIPRGAVAALTTARRRLPAEWEPHDATWLGWPPHLPDGTSVWSEVDGVFARIAAALHTGERVEVLCLDEATLEQARAELAGLGLPAARCRAHLVASEGLWMRDIAGTVVVRDDLSLELLHWDRYVWRTTPWYLHTPSVGAAVARIEGLPRVEPRRPDGGERVALDGGAIDVNGRGMLLATEQHLLSQSRAHNAGFSREDYEQLFRRELGVSHTIWLGEGCLGDATNGHVDNVARFVSADTVVLAVEPDPADGNHERSMDNERRLALAGAGALRVVALPFPRPLAKDGERLPASYANFFIGNEVVLVPTFEDPNDAVALGILGALFPRRRMVGIDALGLLLGLGTIHCLTKEIPRRPSGAGRKHSVAFQNHGIVASP